MSKKQRKNKQKPSQKPHNKSSFFETAGHYFKSKRVHFIIGLLIVVAVVYIGVAILSFFFTGAADQSIVGNKPLIDTLSQKGITNWAGVLGAYLADVIMNRWFGIPSVFMLFLLGSVGFKIMKLCRINLMRRFFLCSMATIWGSVLLAFALSPLKDKSFYYVGGLHGYQITEWLTNNIGFIGVLILLIAGLLLIMIFMSNRIVPWMQTRLSFENAKMLKIKNKPIVEETEYEDEYEEEEEYEDDQSEDENADYERYKQELKNKSSDNGSFKVEVATGDEDDVYDGSTLGAYDPRLDLSSYKFPEVNLLKKYDNADNQVDENELNENRNRIKKTLEDFGIPIVSIKATVGPSITLYEVVQETGIKVSKIKGLEDDIAQSLSALGIRIIAPMPGKGTIGIEVPNKNPKIVSMESVITSRKFAESKYELPIVLGRTITNEVFMFDLVKMPHLLVAGATGQGKSVGLNAIITSLLYKKHPAELKFVLVDPKMVEFNIYEDLEHHYLAKLPDMDKAIITDFSKVLDTLKSLCKEMDDRYALLMAAHVRNISEYNTKFINRHLNPEKGHKYLPYIVVIIDEFGDLIMTARKEIEMPIARIAQKARAVGIHMIIATQRPSVNIITGVIKANFPARIAFKVTSRIDSGTILDTTGANKLVGRGDLLFSQGSELTRVQCAFINTDEIENEVAFISQQLGYESAYPLPEPVPEGQDVGAGNVDLTDRDPFFVDAARMIVMSQQGSTSNIQRKFSIGYNRAGRLMDQLQAAGIVSENDGSKGRQVLIPDEYTLEKLLNKMQIS